MGLIKAGLILYGVHYLVTHHGGCKKHSQLQSPPTNPAPYQQEHVYPPYNDQQYPKQEKTEQSPQYQQYSAPLSSANQDAQISPAYTPMTQNTTVGYEQIPSSITARQGGPEKSPSYSQAYAEGFAAGKAAGSRPQSPERKWTQMIL